MLWILITKIKYVLKYSFNFKKCVLVDIKLLITNMSYIFKNTKK